MAEPKKAPEPKAAEAAAPVATTEAEANPLEEMKKFKPKKKVNGMSGVQIMGHFSDIFDYVMVQMFKEEYQKFQYNFNNIKGKVKTVPKTPIKNTYNSTQNGRGLLNYVRSRNGY